MKLEKSLRHSGAVAIGEILIWTKGEHAGNVGIALKHAHMALLPPKVAKDIIKSCVDCFEKFQEEVESNPSYFKDMHALAIAEEHDAN